MRTICLGALALLLCLPRPAPGLELPLAKGAHFSVAAGNLKEIRYRQTLRQQNDFSCGSAALATLLSYHYADPVSEQQVFEHMYLHGDQQKIRQQGFSLLDIQRYLHRRGYRADGFALPLQQLVEAGLPALVLVSDRGYHHFVVIKGVAGGRVLLGDPSRGTRSMTRTEFEAIWINKLLFVIHGHVGPVRFNDLADWHAAPRAPLSEAIARSIMPGLAKHGPGDF